MSDIRYRLVLNSYPAEDLIPRVCKILYNSTDKNLLASLSSLPYIVGRSFAEHEAHDLVGLLKDLGVGFTFKSQSDDAKDIHFDPLNPSKSTLPDRADGLESVKHLPKKLIFASIIIGLLGAAAFTVPWTHLLETTPDQDAQVTISSGERAATIFQVTNSVETKSNKSLVWRKAELDQVLDEEDSLRTYENSTAAIRYTNGSSLFVKANTLMIVGKAQNKGDRRIDLEDGTIQARLQASASPFQLKIHTKAGVLEMEAPTKPGEESRLETQVKGDRLKVIVTQGTAKLKSANPKAPDLQIQPLQEVEADSKIISKPKPIAAALELLSPSLDSKVVVNPQAAEPINFECESLGNDARYIWELASDESMQNILLKQETQEPKLKVNYLDLGTVYWRVIAEKSETKFVSTPRRLYVEKQRD